jgi:hypothetical protein
MNRAISLREAIRIVRPEYVFLRLKPNNSIRNEQTHKLARTIATLHKNVLESVKRDEIRVMNVLGKRLFIPTRLTYEAPSKVAYMIYIEKKRVEFYFIVPRTYLSVIKEKMSDVWSSITVEEVVALPEFDRDATKYQMSYTKEDALALATNRANSHLLYSTLNVIDVLEEGDRVGVYYNFVPASQFTWRSTYRATIDKVRANKPVDRDKTGTGYLAKMAVTLLVNVAETVAEVLGSKRREGGVNAFEEALERMNGGKRISESTQRKATASIVDTQILVLSRSEDALRQRNNARSLAQSFDTVTEDNALKHRNYSGKFSYTDYRIRGATVNKTGDEECQSFIALAGRDVLERFNFIDRVETQETEVPDDLQAGVMCIGTNRFRGKDTPAYLSNDREFRNLLTLLIGPSRAGKSNLIANLTVDAIEAGECVIIFDFIENCELSDSVAALFPRDKVLEIRCDDYARMQGLGYNEVGRTDDVFKAYVNAKDQTSNVLALVNSINSKESPLSPKMERYLESASLIVFISYGSIKDVFSVLQNHKVRAEFLAKVPRRQYENLEEAMDSLRELDDRDKKTGVVEGTKHNLIDGIIDRLNILKRNPYMELMLKKDTSRNVNLAEEMQKAQLITIKMPQSMFTTDGEKDVCTTYWMTKIWLALQVRADKIRDKAKRTKVNLVVDELYQVENTERFLTAKLSQIAKFIMKPIVSCHYINQLRFMRDELRSANTSYMLIAGCDKQNFEELKSELYPFTAKDLSSLPRYHSMNYIKNADGYTRFITKLPGRVENRARKSETSV